MMSALIWILVLNELVVMNCGDDEDDEDDNDDMMGVAKKKRRRRKMVVMCWRWCWDGPRHLSGKPRTLNPTTCCCFGIQSEVNNHSQNTTYNKWVHLFFLRGACSLIEYPAHSYCLVTILMETMIIKIRRR